MSQWVLIGFLRNSDFFKYPHSGGLLPSPQRTQPTRQPRSEGLKIGIADKDSLEYGGRKKLLVLVAN